MPGFFVGIESKSMQKPTLIPIVGVDGSYGADASTLQPSHDLRSLEQHLTRVHSSQQRNHRNRKIGAKPTLLSACILNANMRGRGTTQQRKTRIILSQDRHHQAAVIPLTRNPSFSATLPPRNMAGGASSSKKHFKVVPIAPENNPFPKLIVSLQHHHLLTRRGRRCGSGVFRCWRSSCSTSAS